MESDAPVDGLLQHVGDVVAAAQGATAQNGLPFGQPQPCHFRHGCDRVGLLEQHRRAVQQGAVGGTASKRSIMPLLA